MRIVALLIILLYSCHENKRSIDNFNNDSKQVLVKVADSLEKAEVVSGQLELKIDEVNKETNLSVIIDSIIFKLSEINFTDARHARYAPINQRIFTGSGYLKTSFLKEYKNKSGESVALVIYDYESISQSVKIFNQLLNSTWRDAILKPGAIVIHHNSQIICLVGACSIKKENWNNAINKIGIGMPRISCTCGGNCEIIL